jgi:hypothetical protein
MQLEGQKKNLHMGFGGGTAKTDQIHLDLKDSMEGHGTHSCGLEQGQAEGSYKQANNISCSINDRLFKKKSAPGKSYLVTYIHIYTHMFEVATHYP